MEAVQAFSSEDGGSLRCILCSLHAAGTGVNLTRADRCFMLDCWWNQAAENRASKYRHWLFYVGPYVLCTVAHLISFYYSRIEFIGLAKPAKLAWRDLS
jgi:hypothetical protein